MAVLRTSNNKSGILRIAYENMSARVSLQPPNGGPLVECFSIPVNLDAGGYVMVSGRSGQNEPDAHKLKMI